MAGRIARVKKKRWWDTNVGEEGRIARAKKNVGGTPTLAKVMFLVCEDTHEGGYL